ncbi:MAG: hypothetical protein AVDCRST_MAG40-1130, partial [uncultured Gemmatimonadaceae bacterium]
ARRALLRRRRLRARLLARRVAGPGGVHAAGARAGRGR